MADTTKLSKITKKIINNQKNAKNRQKRLKNVFFGPSSGMRGGYNGSNPVHMAQGVTHVHPPIGHKFPIRAGVRGKILKKNFFFPKKCLRLNTFWTFE